MLIRSAGALRPWSMGAVSRVAILHPGEMGAALGSALVDVGHEVCWLPAGRSAATRRRAAAA